MKKVRKELLVNEEFRMNGLLVDAVCQVKVYKKEDNGKYEVVISKPIMSKYLGKSTTNNFEDLATGIKKKYLGEVSSDQIDWFDFLEWSTPSYEDSLVKVSLDWNGAHYKNVHFQGRAI
jgi:hypothetical protein